MIDRKCRFCHCTDFSACMTKDGPAASPPAPASARTDTMDSHALRDVVDERARQARSEGFTLDHDDMHDRGELSRAAAAYALNATSDNAISGDGLPACWPREWHPSWWKPTTRRRDLVKAAALILAEIERLDRAETAA